jgi:CelD/BcsL family acetyltransferase involved in cellulose biosynthesis
MTKIETIRSAEEWAALAPHWNSLLQRSHNNVPFLTYEFQRAWWQHLGGGEWPQAELNMLVARGAGGELLGIAPLFRTPQNGKAVLHFIGSHEIADFLDLIAAPQDLAAFAAALVEYLAQDESLSEIQLYNLLDSSATPAALQAVAEQAGLRFAKETLQPSPYIKLPASYESYLGSLDSKQAHELRRKQRKAARSAAQISTETVTSAGELDAALQDFFALMTQEADKDSFLSSKMRIQMEAIARAAFAGGWLQLFFLRAGTERIAGYMNFDYGNKIWGYNAGFCNAFAELSPGWLVMGEMIRWCIENGRQVFDFMRGGEDYKYRFGGVDRFVQKVVISK